MPFKVEYTSSTRPTDLPPDAVITEVARTFPLKIDSGLRRTFGIEKLADGNAYLTVSETDGAREVIYSDLNPDIARELAHALLDVIGDHVSTPGDPFIVKDGEGDYWVRRSSDQYSMSSHEGEVLYPGARDNRSLEYISEQYNGYTVVR